jgi:LPXTG-motif cell wall-anchored protein
VITAWTYDFDKQKIDPETQREVLRIPIPSHNNAIQQLTFDPYLKPWNADYGQLYFSLSYIDEQQDHSLYSGAILRIYPLMFGARNYSVSDNNPFVKTPEINDEIVVMGGQDIKHFFWTKYSHESIFIQHNNRVQHWLSKAKIGLNLHSQTESDYLWQQANEMPSMLLYQGRNFLNLRNKMVFFTLQDNQWHLTSLELESLNTETPIFEKVIATEGMSPRSHLTIHQDQQNEIIIFDNLQSRLYSLQSTVANVLKEDISQSNTGDFETNFYVLIFILVAVLLLGLFFIKRNKSVNKLAIYPLDNGYVRFEYLLSKETILLFKTSHKKAHKTLYLKDIIRCEVILNNTVIKTIDYEPDNVISNEIESDIRDIFTKEQSKTILDYQTRQIEIELSDIDGSYTICLYLRKGNNRVTGAKYYRAVDVLIDLCWVISKRINPELTETRIVPVVTFSRPNLPIATRQTAGAPPSRNVNVNTKLGRSKLTVPKSDILKPSEQPTQQTDVVEALEKLVNLHQQGYLSDEEFSLAKSNLLQ